jgi:hypothetical protein
VVRATFGVDPAFADALDIATTAATDRAGNSAAATINLAVALADATAPTVASVDGTSIADDGGDYVRVFFNEQVDLATALDPASYAITNAGALSLTGASWRYLDDLSAVRIDLPTGVHLDPAQPLTVTVTGVLDVAGNALVAGETFGAVAGDTFAPDLIDAFVNFREDAGGLIVDVLFDEDVDPVFAADALLWTPSGLQTVTAVEALTLKRYRITLDAPLGTTDTLVHTNVPDLAGNIQFLPTIDPTE